jgi:hypothetical protein
VSDLALEMLERNMLMLNVLQRKMGWTLKKRFLRSPPFFLRSPPFEDNSFLEVHPLGGVFLKSPPSLLCEQVFPQKNSQNSRFRDVSSIPWTIG